MLAVRVDAPAEGIAVLERPPVARRDADPQAAVAPEREHLRPVLTRNLGRAIGRAVVDDEHVRPRQPLPQPVEHRRQVLLLVPGGDEDDGVAHRGRRASSARAARSCAGRNGNAASSHTIERRLGATATARNATSTPALR